MSLVESAMKKLWESRPEPHAAATAVASMEARAPGAVPETGKRIVLNRAHLQSLGLSISDAQSRQLAAQYRRIKRPLLAGAFGRGGESLPDGRLIMVASALPGEGKSFTAVNLALSMAMEKDINVLLVDADLVKPHISNAFGVESEPGLIDALQDGALDVGSLIIPTDVPRLSVLPAGVPVETTNELLASNRMQQLVRGLEGSDTRRVVLFDSPPLLLTNESRVLSDVVGQVVLVVRAGATSRRAVTDALAAVAEGRAIGVVLNQASQGHGDTYPGYGEYGSYGA